MRAVDALLRSQGRFSPQDPSVPWRTIIGLIVFSCMVYGAAMGSFGWRPAQSFFSGLKVPILLAVSTLICLPNFFIVNTVLGLRDDFGAACRAVLSAQATIGVTLASLSPVILFVHESTHRYRLIIVINGVLFALATLAGQVTLNRHYEVLIVRNARHAVARFLWLVLYVFVAIQSAWVLRPFVGAPRMPSQFLREDPWSNAYVEVFRDVIYLFR